MWHPCPKGRNPIAKTPPKFSFKDSLSVSKISILWNFLHWTKISLTTPLFLIQSNLTLTKNQIPSKGLCENDMLPIVFHMPPWSALQLIQGFVYFSYCAGIFLGIFLVLILILRTNSLMYCLNSRKICLHVNGYNSAPAQATQLINVSYER